MNCTQGHLKTLTETFCDIPITMVSASLTLADRAHLLNFLGIKASDCRIISGSLDRRNLFSSVQPLHTFSNKVKLRAVYHFLLNCFGLKPEPWRTQSQHSGLIYCSTSAHCIEVAEALDKTYGRGYAKAIYSEKNGMNRVEQRAAVQQWMDGNIQVLVATVSSVSL